MIPLAPIGIRGSAWLASPSGESPDRINNLCQELWGRQFRRIGRFIKLALSGAALAVRNAGIEKLPAERTGVFLGTGLGNLSELVPFSESALGFGNPVPSPIQFVSSVGNAGAFYVAQAFELKGPTLVISQGEASFEAALLSAATYLRAEDIDVALVGGVDVFYPPEARHVLRMGYDDERARGLQFGDGGGWLVLQRRDDSDAATLEHVSISVSDDVEGDLRRHTASFPRAELALGSPLARNARKWVQTWSPSPRLFTPPVPPVTFLTETAVSTCQFLAAPGPADQLFQCASMTGEGRLGLLTVRRNRERRADGDLNTGATK